MNEVKIKPNKAPNYFSKELLWKTIIEGLILALVVWGTQFYFQKQYAPEIAAATLRKENFLNSKRDAYLEAINAVNKYLANSRITDIDNLTGKQIDSVFVRYKDKIPLDTFELDINNAYNKLMIYAPDTSILGNYLRIFVSDGKHPHVPVIWLQKFIIAVRKDLGNDANLPDEYTLVYIAMPKKRTD